MNKKCTHEIRCILDVVLFFPLLVVVVFTRLLTCSVCFLSFHTLFCLHCVRFCQEVLHFFVCAHKMKNDNHIPRIIYPRTNAMPFVRFFFLSMMLWKTIFTKVEPFHIMRSTLIRMSCYCKWLHMFFFSFARSRSKQK